MEVTMAAKGDDKIGGSRAQAAYRALRRAIIDQALQPGMKLPEDAIGERLGVSRTLVREAFSKLAGEGLVQLRQNRGASVAYPSLEEAREVFTVRLGLERLVADLLAGRLAKADRERLARHLAAEDRARDRDGPESIRLAGEFHTLLAQMTGNGLLDRYVQEVVSRCSLILAIYARPHSSDCAVTEHRDIVEALEKGDAERAMTIMDQHLRAVMERALIPPRGQGEIGDVLAAYAVAEGLEGNK
jgi:DNA-binding GntR family transcriptional regulator